MVEISCRPVCSCSGLSYRVLVVDYAALFICTSKNSPVAPVKPFLGFACYKFFNKLFYLHSCLNSLLFALTKRSDHLDSASASELQNFLVNNASRMDQQDKQLRVMGQAIQTLVAQVTDLSAQIQHLRIEAVNPPHCTTTAIDLCYGTVQGSAVDEMKQVFNHTVTGQEAARVLADLCQGHRSVVQDTSQLTPTCARRWLTQELKGELVDLSGVPTEYSDLKEVFSKSQAASLPLHHHYDCAIDLLPGTCSARQSVPFLGYIVSSEGVCMDPDKIKAVVDWPIPDSRKALQRFLGFAIFYQRFICYFSQLAISLTALTSTRATFRWSNASEDAFSNLKSCFVSAPILIAPNPSRQFVVEVNASEVVVGMVLSQCAPADNKMHPHCLSPAERNNDIGNRELLAAKLALEEWVQSWWRSLAGQFVLVWDFICLPYRVLIVDYTALFICTSKNFPVASGQCPAEFSFNQTQQIYLAVSVRTSLAGSARRGENGQGGAACECLECLPLPGDNQHLTGATEHPPPPTQTMLPCSFVWPPIPGDRKAEVGVDMGQRNGVCWENGGYRPQVTPSFRMLLGNRARHKTPITV
ncbi:Transposon Tf2-6 polyprotein [Labeo rohita]|uniref:Transposon Tf2-6 polyprotein n=1 Tax=Labeo rohita TaxID=84645 RepID=A0ABQ8L4A7_LABRO|nr:Transposon Tf2-6 polyprotein [Labeo rohita]